MTIPGRHAACTAAARSTCSRAATKEPSENQPLLRNHSGRALADAMALGALGVVPKRPALRVRMACQKLSRSTRRDMSSVTVSSGAAASQSRTASSTRRSASNRRLSP